MNLERMRELVEKQHRSYNARDLNSFCDCFHPEVEVEYVGRSGVEKGMEKFREGFRKLFETSPNLYCEVKSRMYFKESVFDEEFVTGALKYPDGIHAGAVYQFKDNLIFRISFVL